MIDIPKRQPQTEEEYFKEICLKFDMTEDEIREAVQIELCNCSYSGCTGWIAVPKVKWKIPR